MTDVYPTSSLFLIWKHLFLFVLELYYWTYGLLKPFHLVTGQAGVAAVFWTRALQVAVRISTQLSAILIFGGLSQSLRADVSIVP